MDQFATPAQLVYFGSIIFFSVAEFFRSDRAPTHDFSVRWRTNISLGALAWGVGRIMAPLGIFAAAAYASSLSWGLSRLDVGLSVVLGFVALDLCKYWEHRFLHEIPPLWRLHALHHSDVDIDFTTGFRHHPAEVLATGIAMPVMVLVLGVPPIAVVLYTLIASATSIYTHANVAWPDWLDGVMRRLFVTRALHMVHHSADQVETDSNYGLVLIVWDRLFGTYTSHPKGGIHGMSLGLDFVDSRSSASFRHALATPFRIKPCSPPEASS